MKRVSQTTQFLRDVKRARKRGKDLDKLLLTKLSDALSDEQKIAKVHNLVTSLRRKGLLRNSGSRRKPQWLLLDGSKVESRNN
jgi:mRNA-degrading endonuclease YafQ of YafQ-DinJ toxin-antitoxin module